ncbi:MAG: outer membrane protein assembly factor BamE [Nitrospinaceae bacterium]
MRLIVVLGILVGSLLLAGCGTTGKAFKEDRFEKIVNGSTTRQEVEELFGKPFKKGFQNGKEVWVYEFNKYRFIGTDTSKNIFVVFDDSGVVQTHQYMTSEPTSQ